MIIMNERDYVENLLGSGVFSKRIGMDLNLLAKYYACMGGEKSEVLILLEEFMLTNYEGYNKVKWTPFLDKVLNSVYKYKNPLVEIEYVPITQKELDLISQETNRTKEKVLFTLLCLAKFQMLRTKGNSHGWVNNEDKEVFGLSNTTIKKKDQCLMIGDFYKRGLVELTKKVDDLSKKVTFMDWDGEIALKVYDMRDLGHTYAQYKGERFIRCEECGRLVKLKGNRTKYCTQCAKEINLRKTIENKKK